MMYTFSMASVRPRKRARRLSKKTGFRRVVLSEKNKSASSITTWTAPMVASIISQLIALSRATSHGAIDGAKVGSARGLLLIYPVLDMAKKLFTRDTLFSRLPENLVVFIVPSSVFAVICIHHLGHELSRCCGIGTS